MNKVFLALRQALQACTHARVLFFLFLPFALTLVIGLLLFLTLGTWWVAEASGGIEHSRWMQYLLQEGWLLSVSALASISYFLVLLATLFLLIPISYLLSVLLVSLVLLPFLLNVIKQKDFPELEKKKGGDFLSGFWNTLKVSGIYLMALILSLPLWLFPGVAVVLPILLSSYLNKNIFVYDILQEFASEEERKIIEKENRKPLYILGIILGLINYLPLTFIVAPTFSGLAYSYFCLNALRDLRKDKPESIS
ncbi:MAG: EI24 domain-containing protein [Pseudobdellovibrionaceae bacterium]